MSRPATRSLTPREIEVLELIAQGLTNSEVARRLEVTVHAVKFHLASIYRKLGVNNRTEAAGFFYQHGVEMPWPEEAAQAPAAHGDEPARSERRSAALAAPPPLDLPTLMPPGEGRDPSGRAVRPLDPVTVVALERFAAERGMAAGIVVLAALGAVIRRYTREDDVVLSVGGRRAWLDTAGDPCFDELVARVADDVAEPSVEPLDGRTVVSFGAADGDLNVSFADGSLACDFNRALFAAEMVERLLGHLETLLASGIDEPARTVGRLDLLTAEERRLQLHAWNDTACAYPSCRADELVADQAARRPDAVAAVFEDASLTYRELDARANALAHVLVELGVGPGVLVALCVDRSLEMLVGVLAIMRSGGAYVPVDPAFPSDRKRFMIEDANVRVVVTQERLLGELPEHHGAVVCVDRDAEWIARRPTTAPATTATAEDLAYVIYTSGSTGVPKGVQIPHRALVNFLTTMAVEPGMHADDVLVAVTTLSFDIAGLELYLPLVTGARVVIAPQATAADPRLLAALIERSRATVVQATPTTWRMLVDSGWPGRPGLKALCGGEALPAALADALVDLDLELWNMYGPTETTIWSAISRVERGKAPTLGSPIGNTSLYVLDASLELAPVGVPGELHIGGDGLARGYLERPELTAERFVPHPFVNEPGARIYKTGDLVRRDASGDIEFLGRLDHQVKVRGYRIELGEIETALARHPEVAAAVAIVREDTPGDVRIVGYVVPLDGAAVDGDLLRRHAGESLPSYMVPSAVVSLTEFPLTPNGKIDRKALPVPAAERSESAPAYVAPRTPLERKLVDVWERELGISPVGVTDDFFSLGVTSIVAARLFARLEREVGNSLPLGAVFQAPTVERLAALLEKEGDADRWTSLVPIQPNGSRPPFFCVHGGAGTVLHLQPLARLLGHDQPFYGLQMRGLYGGAPPIRSVEEMATHYLAELRTVQPQGPYYLGGYCFGAIVAFEMAQRLLAEGESIGVLAMFNGPSPTWIRKYGSIGRQPSRVSERVVQPQRPLSQRVLGVLASPQKMVGWARHLRWKVTNRFVDPYRVRFAMAFNRPLPERVREIYFLEIAGRAEWAYQPKPYPGPLLLFHGAGLYDDADLGWTELVASIENVAVPGEHSTNRDLMAEPAVVPVAGRMHEALAAARENGPSALPDERAASAA